MKCAPFAHVFQYQFVALWRYGAKLFNRRNEANLEMNKLQDRLNQLERKTAGMAALTAPEQSEKDKLAIMMMNLRQEHGELMERMEFLEKEINEVQPMIDQWDNWKTRQTEITAYLNFLAPLARYTEGLSTMTDSMLTAMQSALVNERKVMGTRSLHTRHRGR